MLKLESAYAVRKSGKLGSEAGGERRLIERRGMRGFNIGFMKKI